MTHVRIFNKSNASGLSLLLAHTAANRSVPRISLTLRILYAACLTGATWNHVALHLRFGVMLEGLTDSGISTVSRLYWSSLTLLDPLAAVLMFIRPREGLVLALAIIVSDVAHNSWVLHAFSSAPNWAYWCQVSFLVFLSATIHTAWRGLESNPKPSDP